MMCVDRLHRQHPGDAVALVEQHRVTSYADLERMVAAVAGGLANAGVRPDDRVAVWLNKTTAAVVALLATMRAGAIAIPVNPLLKAAQVGHILADSGAALLLTNAARAATLEAVDNTVMTIEADWPRLSEGAAFEVPRAADDLAAILYTSGSTGRPKGVMLTHANLALGAESVATYLEIGSADRTLCVLPLSFDYGLNQVLTALRQGGQAILLDYLLPRDVVKAVERHRATGLAGVPPLWMQLADVEWPERSTLRYITNSGGRMPAALSAKLRRLLPATRIYLMYGLTEAFRSTYLDPALVDTHPDSIGGPIPYAEVRVLRADGSEADDGEPGELVHSGPLVARGYWNDPDRTARRFRRGADGRIEVWSGDTVVRRNGLLYFVGRNDEMIKTSGNRVSPTEIEEAVFATGAVSAVAAFGVPDERLGQVIVVVASPAAGRTAAEAEALARTALPRTVPAYMLPRDYHWRDALPLGANGKLDRVALRAELAA
jgi:acyl-CoA ligase (AMP-forming) (exosortase A-associated)